MRHIGSRYLLVLCTMIVVVAFLGASAIMVHSEGGSDLLAFVSAGTQNATNSIHSGMGKIVQHTWRSTPSGGTSEVETTYTVAFSGEKFKLAAVKRIIQNTPGPNEDARMLIPTGTTQRYTVGFNGTTLTVFYNDDEAANVLNFNRSTAVQPMYWRGISPRSCGFFPVIAPPGSNSTAVRQTADGEEYVVVDTVQSDPTLDNHNFTSKASNWVNTRKGFAVVKRLVHGHDDIYKEDVLLDEMTATVRDYGSGIWGPDTCSRVSYRRSKSGGMQKIRTEVVTYDPSFRLNIAVTDDDISLTLPKGTKVVDETLDATYTVP